MEIDEGSNKMVQRLPFVEKYRPGDLESIISH
jgi:hypothetical protein